MSEIFHIPYRPLPAPCQQTDTLVRSAKREDDLPEPEFTLDQLLDRFNPIPPQTILVGLGEDESPLYFDLNDPQPGPLLVLGNSMDGNLPFLQILLASAGRSVEAVKLLVFSNHPQAWQSEIEPFISSGSCLGVYSPDESDGGDWILRMAGRVEKRQSSGRHGAPVLILIDDMSFLIRADADIRLNFEWLCTHGPRARVWMAAALTTSSALELGRWVRYFRTRIIGHMPNSVADRLGLYSGLNASALVQGRQFSVRVQEEWLRFWLPVIENHHNDLKSIDSENFEVQNENRNALV